MSVDSGLVSVRDRSGFVCCETASPINRHDISLIIEDDRIRPVTAARLNPHELNHRNCMAFVAEEGTILH
jgi:hypothetical protein